LPTACDTACAFTLLGQRLIETNPSQPDIKAFPVLPASQCGSGPHDGDKPNLLEAQLFNKRSPIEQNIKKKNVLSIKTVRSRYSWRYHDIACQHHPFCLFFFLSM
jgi:hypothetical protein